MVPALSVNRTVPESRKASWLLIRRSGQSPEVINAVACRLGPVEPPHAPSYVACITLLRREGPLGTQGAGSSFAAVELAPQAALFSALLCTNEILVNLLPRERRCGSGFARRRADCAADVLSGRWCCRLHRVVLRPHLSKREGGGAYRHESKCFHVD